MAKAAKARKTTKRKMDAEDRADARRGIKQTPAEERADRAKKKPAKRAGKKMTGKKKVRGAGY